MDYQQVLLRYVRDHLAEDPSQILGPEQPLISSGLLDSLCLVDLQTFIAEELQVRLPDAEVTVADFDTIAGMARVIARHVPVA